MNSPKSERHLMRIARLRTVGLLAAGIAVAGLAFAGAASAHVTVSAPGATSGGSDQIITFRVPTESATASTVGLKVQLPTDTPIASVLVQPTPGWTNTQKSVTLKTPIKTDDGDITQAVSEIDWTASSPAEGIKPGEFDEFVIIAGQLPDAKSLTFKAIQLYSDKSQVAWTDVAAPGSTEEPDHPAPVLDLGAAAATPEASTTPSSGPTATLEPIPGSNSDATPTSSSNTVPTVLAVIALVIAVVGAGLAAMAFRARRGGGA
jgi:uncharacterized protein